MLEVSGVTVRYGHGAAALDALHLRADRDRITAVVGGNGAGKTTLMRVVSGVLGTCAGRWVAGDVRFDGRSLAGLSAAAIVRLGIAHVPEGRQVFTSLTVEENLHAGGVTRRSQVRELTAACFDLFPVLAKRRRQRAGLLSGGEQQMLAIARGLMSAPRLILLDEPTLGLAPIMVDQIRVVVKQLRAHGTTVVIVEQNAAMALQVADSGYVLEQGRATLEGPAESLRSDPTVRDLYLGGSHDDRHELDVETCLIGRWSR